MDKNQFDRIVRTQVIYWVIATLFATGFALFAKLIWTAKFPILLFLPIAMMAFALGSLSVIKKELTPMLNSQNTTE